MRITLAFPLATTEDLFEELERVDRALDRADEGLIIDQAQLEAHKARLRNTRSQVMAQLDQIAGAAA